MRKLKGVLYLATVAPCALFASGVLAQSAGASCMVVLIFMPITRTAGIWLTLIANSFLDVCVMGCPLCYRRLATAECA